MRPLMSIVERYHEKRSTQRLWKRISRAMAVVVLLLTMSALMLPAVTSEQFVTVNMDGNTAITISNVNYYEPDEVILIDGYTVAEFIDPKYNGDGKHSFDTSNGIVELTDEAKASFVDNQPTFIGYTAVIVEYLNNGQNTGVQYYVDAVITCTQSTILDPGVTMTNLSPKTHNGFIVYIPTKFLTEENTPRRGDLVSPDFWHWNPDVIVGRNKNSGTLVLVDNPTENHVLATATSTAINATVKVFDYDRTINNIGNEFYFWNGDYGYGADVESVDGWGVDFIYVDDTDDGIDNGKYVGANPFEGGNISMEAYHGYNKRPIMSQVLSQAGYPQILDQTPGKENNIIALDYLFNSTHQEGATMTDGGGLFQQDESGYYYYDSGQNYAYFNGSRFILYQNLVVRPWADSNDTSNQAYGNFLPLNAVNTGNVTLDGYYFVDEQMGMTSPVDGQYGLTGWLGSLNVGAGQDIYSALATLDNDGNNRLKQSVYESLVAKEKYSARLEDKTNLWFGMSVEFAFYQPVGGKVNNDDMIFDFNGDDDVWVYVGVWNTQTLSYDYKLVLDIGGAHEARDGKINFATGEVVYKNAADVDVSTNLGEIFGLEGSTFADYTKLSLKFFYMERGGNISYCRLRFNIPTVPDKSLMVTKELQYNAGDEALKDYITDAYPYQFRVVQADADGKPTDKILIKEGAAFSILENGVAIGTGVVGENGIFTLKAGQSALFENLLETYGNADYVVQELIDSPYSGQYSGVWYTVGGGTNTATNVDTATSENFLTYSSGALNTSQSEYVVYRNQVDTTRLSALQITKEAAAGATFAEGTTFQIRVTLGGKPIPVGATYLVGSEERTVTTEGILELAVGETATIGGILAGTAYTVEEVVPDNAKYFPTYTGKTSGAVGLHETVAIVITNADFATMLEIPISKTYLGNTGSASFDFTVEQVTADGDHVAYLDGCSITVADSTATSGTVRIKFSAYTADGIYYYRICEKPGTENAAYDTKAYLVAVTVTKGKPAITGLDGQAYQQETLTFVNQKLTDISITKTVTGNISAQNLKFRFTAKVLFNGKVYQLPSGSDYTVDEAGTVSFELAVGETVTIQGVPVGAEITVTEEDMAAFLPSFTVGESTTSGNTVTLTAAEGSNSIVCNNEGLYVLPSTGGAGTIPYTMAGLVLILFSTTCLLYITQKRRRGDI